ncbi:MAG TPA: HAMP domain-containing sensor histidine kinase [Prolixibacteraceae bacterium]|nr:HAMP domain-containing sensor histidine kinase [Prolixibacteraceae bacterium]
MDIYFKKRRWKQILFIFAILIGIGSMLYTNKMVKKLSEEELIRVELWAEATRLLATENELDENITNYLIQVLSKNTTIPIIIVDKKDQIMVDGNIKYNSNNKEKILAKELAKMKARQQFIVIPLGDGDEQYLFYKESSLQSKLRYYPIFQLSVIVLFIAIAYIAFSQARKAEQNLVWIGLAKETAHQLGTPISSLVALVELLKEENVSKSIVEELDKDAQRLEKITERFSKIGSQPELYPENLYQQLGNIMDYLKTRISRKIEITCNFSPEQELYIPLSASLFSWVIENLVRNSVDSIENNPGIISINVSESDKDVIIDVSDNGKGIPKSKQKTIFNPGYTTKKRGWGLGLSLSKRIVEYYHKGKLVLKSSDPKKLTIFRITLKK